jgi:uncharacterized surface protein with fasciclin (FAS1) repeats
MYRRGFLALGTVATGSLAMPGLLRAQARADIADTLAGDTRFTRFLDFVTRATMVQDLRASGPLTLFAPVDQAFTGLPAAPMQDLLTLGNQRDSASAGDTSERQRWVALINYHLVPGALRMADVQGADRRVRTRNGADLQIINAGGAVRLQNPAPAQQMAGFGAFGAQANPTPAEVLGQPVEATNGLIYPINQILWP